MAIHKANITKLSRITPGEISSDQAVIDYFYDDSSIWIGDIVQVGTGEHFFDRLSGKFQIGSKIRIRAQRAKATHPDYDPDIVTVTYKVSGMQEYNPPRSYKLVSILPTVDVNVIFSLTSTEIIAYDDIFYKHRGLISYSTTPTAAASGYDDFALGNVGHPVKFSLTDFCRASFHTLDSSGGAYIATHGIRQVAVHSNYGIRIYYQAIDATNLGPAVDIRYLLFLEVFNKSPIYLDHPL